MSQIRDNDHDQAARSRQFLILLHDQFIIVEVLNES